MAEAAAKERSMEDILSSIRQIIAEDGKVEETLPSGNYQEALPVHANSDAPVETGETGLLEVLSATETPDKDISAEKVAVDSGQSEYDGEMPMDKISSAPVSISGIDATRDDVREDDILGPLNMAPEPVQELPSPPGEAVVRVAMADARPALRSDPSIDEAEAFKGALMSPSTDDAVAGSFDRLKRSGADEGLEARSEAILRPMLREWLDENLPTLVERLVREEIERVARGT